MNYANLKLRDGSPFGNKFDALVDAVKAANLNPGRGYMLKQTPLGTTLDIQPGKGGGGSTCPFDISIVSGSSPGTIGVSLSPGTVNNLLPSNYTGVFNVSDAGLKYIKIDVVTDGSRVTSCSVDVDTSAPIPPTPTPFGLPEATSILVGVVANQYPYKLIGCGSIQLLGYEEYKVDKDPPAEPGELPYTPYYTLRTEII